MIGHWRHSWLRKTLLAAALAALFFTSASTSSLYAAPKPAKGAGDQIHVDAGVALTSLMSLADGHLQSIADLLKTLAATDDCRSAEWNRIKGPLAELAERSIPAAAWFALPDGAYWTVDNGSIAQKLSDRPYFPRLLAGKTVIGDLVVSKSTGKAVAIVAVPIMSHDSVVGALGFSVHLDKLSNLIEKEMGLDKSMIFYSFNAQPLLALVWDTQLVFLEPMKQPELKKPFGEMMSGNAGMVNYTFRGRNRTVVYRRSSLTNWWYAFGIVSGNRE